MDCNIHPDVWIAWGTWGLVFATFLLVIATGFFVWRQILEAKQSSGLQLFVRLANRYEDPNMRDLRRKFSTTLLNNSQEPNLNSGLIADETVLSFFENLAYLTHIEVLNIKIVWNYFSTDISGYWAATHQYINADRLESDDNALYVEFEWLQSALVKLDAQAGRGDSEWDNDDVREFLENETRLT